ncbi:MAG: M28 family peptidase [Desulfurococcaceae archaeon]
MRGTLPDPRELSKALEGLNAQELLAELVKYHRIQGSPGINEAARRLSELLDSLGLGARKLEVPLDTAKGWVETPIAWSPLSARLTLREGDRILASLSLDRHPTLLAAHSPPGEGCAELSLATDKEGLAVITSANPYQAYRELNAPLIVHYNLHRHPSGVPYTGLFLRSNELVPNKVVMNLPGALALKLIEAIARGRRIEACWEAKVSWSSAGSMDVVHTCEGGEEVLYVSHVCHPRPGAHDNASGSVANLLAAVAISKALGGEGGAVCHAWVPEYTGTAYMDSALRGPSYSINLDMVGSRQWITGSALAIVNPPAFYELSAPAALFVGAKHVLDSIETFSGARAPSIRYDVSPYSLGSDHDVMIVWGVDASMLNEWPSKYYHTDLDSPETISSRALVATALASATAALVLVAKETLERAREVYLEYLRSWYSAKAMSAGVDTSPLSKILGRGTVPPYDTRRAVPSSRALARALGWKLYNELKEVRGGLAYVAVYRPLAEEVGLEEPLKAFEAEQLIKYGAKEKALIDEASRALG